MKSRLALLYIRDDDFERAVRRALFDTGTTVLVARTVGDALQIVCQRGRELDLAVMDFSEDCHGMTLLSAIHGCYEQLPTLVVVGEHPEHGSALAYANGARFCLNKPVSSVELANVVAELHEAEPLNANANFPEEGNRVFESATH
jgi:DNA-binding NtrC family response regulator